MLTEKEQKELLPIIIAQYNILNKIKKKVDDLKKPFDSGVKTKEQIEETERMLVEVIKDIESLSEEDILGAQKEVEEINLIYDRKRNQIECDIEKIKFNNWDDYVAESYKYLMKYDIDPFTPYEMFLSKLDLDLIKSEEYNKQFKWDPWDYTFVGIAGIVGALTDFFIAAIPKDMTSGVYKGQKGSPLTQWLQGLKLPDGLQTWLESSAKVPYDTTGGSLHRIDTFGHDPFLGLIFGVVDIMIGSSSYIHEGNIIIEKKGIGADPLEALVKQFLHLCSDVCTKKGLPVPFASAFELLKVGRFKRSNGKTATINQLTTWMYYHGYDLRHFVTMGITPASIEIILRMYIMIRYYVENDDDDFKVGSNPKYRSMLLSSHSIACAADVGKVYLKQGNPLAINYAEWLMLMRYLVPSVKYWLFDRSELKLKYLENINDSIWEELLNNSDELLIRSKYEFIKPIDL